LGASNTACPRLARRAQNDLRLAKEKVKRKAAILARQEEEIASRDKSLEEAVRQEEKLQQSNEGLRHDKGRLQVMASRAWFSREQAGRLGGRAARTATPSWTILAANALQVFCWSGGGGSKHV
jgi:hypothetical protein